MADKSNLDLAAAHKYFAVQCYNDTWKFLDKESRTPAENEEMIRLAITSFWHWTQVPDCKPVNLSIGYWQLSRAHALAGKPEEARHYAERCLDVSEKNEVGPFFLGYAHEAMTRAHLAAGDKDQARKHWDAAQKLAADVKEEEDSKLILADLQNLWIGLA